MFLKRTLLAILIILLTCVSALWAGDSAVFADLGFSQDGRTFMFGQHGVLSPSLKPWAELYIVDVASNRFVQDGRVSFTENTPIRAMQDGSGILQRLLSNSSTLIGRYGINLQNKGLPLYISRDEVLPARGETIEFRDFINRRSYTARLVPTITGSGQNVSSKFHIELSARNLDSGQTFRNYPLVGTPDHIRRGISQYNFKRVIIDETGSSIIFVIEMRRTAENGHDIRYMVEAVRL
ncbi:MAG: DUF2259 domain-containing protein [Treponema sp.]|nr:DUF2259 domain-containing protein [Treponema sp.]MCL2237884.1 DUF2259 domain-containing protein [Treponema sp.]